MFTIPAYDDKITIDVVFLRRNFYAFRNKQFWSNRV